MVIVKMIAFLKSVSYLRVRAYNKIVLAREETPRGYDSSENDDNTNLNEVGERGWLRMKGLK